ncbi:MAG: SMC-Scp complex subunit ScpB [Chloroflexi bacterium]|nr:SMC-Scp complex subunit ScpB [Chloroflexota bacterium]
MTDETHDEEVQARVTAPPRPFDDESLAPALEPEALDAGAVAADDAEEAAAEAVDLSELVEPEPFEDLAELPALLEALLFVADHPVDPGYLSRAIEVSVTRVERSLDALAEALRESKRGIRLQRGPAGVQLVSAPEAAAQVERFLGLEANRRLSTAALETLAIIAYRQPVTRGQVDAVRGVSSDGAIATLRARELIEPAGHAPGPGRPMLFRTTQRFLEHFGLERPGQLPPLPDDIELPPSDIGEQLGLDQATIAAALRPVVAAPDGVATGARAASEDADADLEAIVDAVSPALQDVEIPADLQALSEAAEHAFEASRDRRADDADDEMPVAPA